MRNRVWVGANDVVLCSLREFEDRKCDITLKYMVEEIKKLKAEGERPYSLEIDKKDDEEVPHPSFNNLERNGNQLRR